MATSDRRKELWAVGALVFAAVVFIGLTELSNRSRGTERTKLDADMAERERIFREAAEQHVAEGGTLDQQGRSPTQVAVEALEQAGITDEKQVMEIVAQSVADAMFETFPEPGKTPVTSDSLQKARSMMTPRLQEILESAAPGRRQRLYEWLASWTGAFTGEDGRRLKEVVLERMTMSLEKRLAKMEDQLLKLHEPRADK